VKPRRVAITGIGALTPVGHGRTELWKGVLRERSAVRRITHFDPSPYRSQIAAEVDGFDPLDWMDAKKARRLDRYSQFSLACARMALADAGLTIDPGWRDEAAVYVGSALGGLAYAEQQHAAFLDKGLRAVEPMLALSVFAGASSCNVAMELGITGPNMSNTNSCASGAVAIGEAFRLIKYGGARMAIAGGVETPLAPLTFSSFSVIRALSTRNDEPGRASRPFDRERDGFVMGEAAVMLVLEDLQWASARDAHIYGEMLGYGLTSDAYNMIAPLPGGLQSARAMQLALGESKLQPGQIGYLNAHASSTQLGDAAEVMAIRQVFGSDTPCLPISGTKGLHGHALGASGAEEMAITVLALHEGHLPATVNLEQPDADCRDLDLVPRGRDQTIDYAMCNSFGFGGINSSLVVGQTTVGRRTS
jgi:3-oxoacyl-[acyl-carrier-protein] synthase II